MKRVELLSPAGNMECFKVAIEAGADAVYISGKSFGARSFADNFTNDEITEAIIFAHLRNKKVYVTVNTIIFEDEISIIDDYLKFLSTSNVDALIVQDLGLIKYIKTNYPNLVIHGSTQINIYNLRGVKALESIGVERTVLARETNLETISEITKLGHEVEVFIHGALCFSSSGNCYLSSRIGGRSGNRGKCAQPCRKTYQIIEDDLPISDYKAFMSMKDLMTIDDIPQIIDAGVASLKIEGRMKSKEYVYAVTKAYRNAIDSYYNNKPYSLSKKEFDNILVSFNREFTKGYLLNENNNKLTNPLNVNHQGIIIGKVVECNSKSVTIKLSKDVSLHDGLRIIGKNELGIYVTSLAVKDKNVKKAFKNEIVTINIKNNVKLNDVVVKTSSSELGVEVNEMMRLERCKTDVDLNIYLYAGRKLKLSFSTFEYHDTVETNILERSDNQLSDERIKEQLSKLTSTVYQTKSIKIHRDNTSFISISMLNEIRNLMIFKLNEFRLNRIIKSNAKYEVSRTTVVRDYGLHLDIVVSNDKQKEALADFAGDNITIYEKGKEYGCRINDINAKFIHNLSENMNNKIASPYFNVVNRYNIDCLHDLGVESIYLSPEIDKKGLEDLKINYPNIGLLCYGAIDLMVSKHCIIGDYMGATNKHCGSCLKHNYKLRDNYGNDLPLVLEPENDCTMRITDYDKINLYKRLNEILNCGIRRILLVFTDEDADNVRKIAHEYARYLFENTKINQESNYLGFYLKRIL